jgi:hypothetical protein
MRSYDQNTDPFQYVQKAISRIDCKSDLGLVLLRVTWSRTCFLDHGYSLIDLSCLDRHHSPPIEKNSSTSSAHVRHDMEKDLSY